MGAPATSDLPVIVSFWHGELSWLEKLCITSFLKAGHSFRLYAYQPVEGLPEGAEWRSAAEILPQDRMFFYKKTGTPAVFSDLFRLELMRQDAGLWADCDIYCLKPFADLGDYVFGYEVMPEGKKPGSINNAVFRVPADSELLSALLALFDPDNAHAPAPFLPRHRRLEVFIRRLFGEKLALSDMQFGATGPFPLTWHIKRLGLEAKAQKREVFYPVPYEAIPGLMQAGSALSSFVTDETLCVHIWRSQLTDRGRAGISLPEPGSALAALCERDGIDLSGL